MKKILKTIIPTIIIILLVIYCIITYRKFNIINEIINKYSNSNNLENYYYYCDKIKPDHMIQECWKKDNITKLKTYSKEGHPRTLIHWKNNSLNEIYVIYELDKTYEIEHPPKDNSILGITDYIPGKILATAEKHTINLFILNPLTNIKSTIYENKECYFIKYNDIEEYIDKETGLILWAKDKYTDWKLKYNFDSVTSEDVELPDLTDYKRIN